MKEDPAMQESMASMPSEPPPHAESAPPSAGRTGIDDPRALQILSTEHWSLLATRSLAYNEAFSRAGMFLTFLSASLIVIGFLIGAQGLTPTVVPIATVLLLADLFIGTATVGRLIGASGEDLQCVRGMNRIRHAYREMVPELEPYFVSGFHDDARGVLATYGDVTAQSAGILPNVLHGLTTTVAMVALIDIFILGSVVAIIAIGLGAGLEIALPLAGLGFLLGFVVFAYVGMRTALGQQARAESRFPTPPEG
jgi:hypothetical protein